LIDARTGATFYAGFSPQEDLGSPPTVQTDVFALGALLYALYTRQMPPKSGLSFALEHLNVTSSYLGVDYLIRKALWPATQFRLSTAVEFSGLLESIVGRRRRTEDEPRENDVAFDVGADFNVGLRKGHNRGYHAVDNEDRLFWDMDVSRGLGLLTIADGVTRSDIGTGYGAAAVFAEQANQLWRAVQRNPAMVAEPADALTSLFADANRRIVQAIAEQLRGRPVASTDATMAAAACAILCHGARATVANLGDVRAYLATPGWIGKVTHDDTAVSDAILDPSATVEDVAKMSGATLSSYLGRWKRGFDEQLTPVAVTPHVISLTLVPGESLVIASDGAWGANRDSEEPFEDTLLKILASTDSAQVAAFRLMSVANQRGGKDNISCIVCRYLALNVHA
jgi:serine/threonine protein phosphatase PrpC